LFHSFGEFNVATNTTANFLNNTSLPTSNILGRVTGGNLSSIYGTIQTTGFGNANLFLMNPAGFLFGPNATLNVGGMVAFTSADYIRLADSARFNVIAGSADALLTAAPVAAFGFLGSNPGAITVQGSQLSVAEGTGISLIGGDIIIRGGTLKAPSGEVDLVSVGSPSNANVSGEVVVAGADQGARFTPIGFRSLGNITLAQGSTVDASVPLNNSNDAGSVVIRGGQFVMDSSLIEATNGNGNSAVSGGSIDVTAQRIALSNHSAMNISTSSPQASPGHIKLNVGTLLATDSAILATGVSAAGGGAVIIQGLEGTSTFASSISLTKTEVATSAPFSIGNAGPILLRADKIMLNQSTLSSNGSAIGGGPGSVDLNAATSINLSDTIINASGAEGGSITIAAPTISIRGVPN
jgi:filamentous hemagglutinin family protein